MGEVSTIIQNIRKDKNEFVVLVEKMSPLINKYVRLLYKDEREDIHSEMVLALWEAVLKIEYYDNDGKCLMFLSNALRNKFLELYRKSKREHENQTLMDTEVLTETTICEEQYESILFYKDLEKILNKYDGKKKDICMDILFLEKSDSEMAKKHQVSRQYANRLRRAVYEEIKIRYI